MNVLISGVKNYIAEQSLSLMAEEGVRVFALSSSVSLFKKTFSGELNAQVFYGDLIRNDFDESIYMPILDVGYYFIQASILTDVVNVRLELLCLRNFITYLKRFNCKRLIYISTLADKSYIEPFVSLFLEMSVDYTVVLTSNVIGKGSAIERLYSHLSLRKIILQTNVCVSGEMQPVAITDLVSWLKKMLLVPKFYNNILEVGGREYISFTDFFLLYKQAKSISRKSFVFSAPQWLVTYFYRFVLGDDFVRKCFMGSVLCLGYKANDEWMRHMDFKFMSLAEALSTDQ